MDMQRQKSDADQASERIRQNEAHLDAIRGSLIGGAAGDALGYAVEFNSYGEICGKYGKSGIQSFEPDPVRGTALISDDTQMTLFTANGILFADTRMCLDGTSSGPTGFLDRAYRDWLHTQTYSYREFSHIDPAPDRICWLMEIPELYEQRSPGNTCLSALRLREYNQNNGIEKYYSFSNPINNSKGCGGIMRVAPVGLFMQTDPRDVVLEGARCAAVTHGNSLGYMPAGFQALLLNRIVFGQKEPLLQSVLKTRETVASVFGRDDQIAYLLRLVDMAVSLVGNGKPDEENVRTLGEGWVAEETLAIALYCSLQYEHDFSGGIRAAVNHSGDSDSTGAVAGNILGALIGYDAIDNAWKDRLELRDVLLTMADDLCRGCQMDAYSTYTDPDWQKKY